MSLIGFNKFMLSNMTIPLFSEFPYNIKPFCVGLYNSFHTTSNHSALVYTIVSIQHQAILCWFIQ